MERQFGPLLLDKEMPEMGAGNGGARTPSSGIGNKAC